MDSMNTDDDFVHWLVRHVEMFALSPEDAKTVALWRGPLAVFTVAELESASDELLKSAPKSFRNDHVPTFFRILAKKRRHVGAKTTCTCKTCRGEANVAEETAKFSFVQASKRYEDAKKQNDKVPF